LTKPVAVNTGLALPRSLWYAFIHHWQTAMSIQSRRAALTPLTIYRGLSRPKCSHTRRVALITAPAQPREHSPDGETSTHPIKLVTTQFIDSERMKGWVGLIGSADL